MKLPPLAAGALGSAVLLGLLGCQVTAPWDSEPARATPQRPTFSSNTETTAEGTLEFQGGLLLDWKDRFATPTELKYGATPSTELFVGWAPYVNYDTMGIDGSSVGDTLVGMRQRLQDATEDQPAAALQLATLLPTADESEIGTSGETDFFVAGILDVEMPGVSWTGFGQLGLLGEPDGDDVDVQWLVSSTATSPIYPELDAFGEAAVLYTPERDEESLYMTFGTYYWHKPSQVFDASVQIGVGSNTPDFAVLVGFTQNLGRISNAGR